MSADPFESSASSSLERSALFDHQLRAVELIKARRQLLLLMRPGGGKTAATLTALKDLRAWPALIVAPIRVCETVWRAEAARWAHLQGLTIRLVRGSPKAREDALSEPAHAYLINYELLPWLDDLVRLESFNAIIWDEVSLLKKPGTVRFRAIRRALERSPRDQVRVGLTGTPTGNSLLNLWGESYVCTGARAFGSSYVKFRSRYFTPVDKDQYVWVPQKGTELKLRRRLGPCAAFIEPRRSITRGFSESQIQVKLPRVALSIYRQLDATFTAKVKGKDVLALGQLPLAGKLRQVLSGAIYTGPEEREWAHVHDARLDALVDLVEELEGSPLLVAYQFTHERERIHARFPESRDITERGAIDAWNRGRIPILTLHPLSGGHGLNLQQGGADLCWFSLPWSWEQYSQTIGRLDRPGQPRVVSVFQLVTPGTVDLRVLGGLQHHAQTEHGISQALLA